MKKGRPAFFIAFYFCLATGCGDLTLPDARSFDTATSTSADTHTGNDTETATDPDPETDTTLPEDTETHSDTDADSDTQCRDRADGFSCVIDTLPDRSWDICVNQICVSPGCGDASCNVPGPLFPLPDTNQRSCWNLMTTITCPALAEFAYGQDAQYGWDVLHTADERFVRDTDASEEPTVTDMVTGLVWQGCAAGLSGNSCENGTATSMNWFDALALCEALDWAGDTDWRLPDDHALVSIVDFDQTAPSIAPTAFPATPPDRFWTSTSAVDDARDGWIVQFSRPAVNVLRHTESARVRCVRGGVAPTERFSRTSSTNPEVTDQITSLVWQGCTAGLTGSACTSGTTISRSWSQGLDYCEGLVWNGTTNWRLPNATELRSIVDTRFLQPAVNETVFPGFRNTCYWTATSDPVDAEGVTIHFSDGQLMTYESKNDTCRIVCVKSLPQSLDR